MEEIGVEPPKSYEDLLAAAKMIREKGLMVSATVDILLNEINGAPQRPRRIAIDGPLIVRGSARIPEGWKNEGF